MTRVVLLGVAAAATPLCLCAHVPAPGVAPEAHRPLSVAGARYRTVLSALPYSDPSQNPTGALFNAELAALPVFRDCALVNHSSLRRTPKDRPVFRRLEDNYSDGTDDPRWRSFDGNPKPDRPLFSYMVTKRDAAALVGPIDLDREQYARWKAAHTNFFSFRILSEWGVIWRPIFVGCL